MAINVLELKLEKEKLEEIAMKYGTPFFVYSEALLKNQYQKLLEKLRGAEIFYSMKANPNPMVCNAFKELGAGIEVASEGELSQALNLGFEKNKIFFTAPTKSENEIKLAIENDILAINIDNWQEIEVIKRLAAHYKKQVNITLRIHQEIKEESNRGIKMTGDSAQFGVTFEEIIQKFTDKEVFSHLNLIGIHTFQGSENFNTNIYEPSWEEMMNIIKFLEGKGCNIKLVGLGGGFGFNPLGKTEFNFAEFEDIIGNLQKKYPFLKNKRMFFESGTFLTRSIGTYYSKVLYTKQRKNNHFVFVDGGTHHIQGESRFTRMFSSYKKYIPIPYRNSKIERKSTVVGKLCTPNDILCYKKNLGDLRPGDIIAFENSGAYELTSTRVNFLSHKPPYEIFLTSHGDLKLNESQTVK